MIKYYKTLSNAVKQQWNILLLISIGFMVLYYVGLLLVTMLRFGEIPNYVEFYDLIGTYRLIYEGTPSLQDALPIFIDEPWFEAGYKNPEYYGVATWSFMLIPPKMLLVLLMGILLGIFAVLVNYSRKLACTVKTDKRLFAVAGMGSVLISLTSATLTWVVCCATPSWVVALAMLGMSASLALWIEPLGSFLSVGGLVLMVWIIIVQLKKIEDNLSDALNEDHIVVG